MPTTLHLTAIGDCNTLGANHLEGNSYPERIAKRLGAAVTNLGHTMATTREGLHLLRDFSEESDLLLIQFGLVDCYTTFKYAPYILYYPNSLWRRPLRSLVKKFKKICRGTGLNRILGEKNVVSLEEFERNLRTMVEMFLPRTTFLIDTIPNMELARNVHIQRYNIVMDRVSGDYDRCIKIDLYDIFASRTQQYYQDSTHCSDAGYDCITDIICRKLQQIQPQTELGLTNIGKINFPKHRL